MNFIAQMISRAKSNKKIIVLPEGSDIRTLQAAAMIQKESIADLVILGNKESVHTLAGDLDISLSKIVDPAQSARFDEYVETLLEMRKSKGMTLEQARETMKNPLYYGVMMVKKGEADGMVGGANNSTGNTLRPALQIIKTAPGISRVSGFFIMVVPDCEYGHHGTFIYADSGLLENPTAEELAEIAILSARSFKDLIQAEPKVAMLSYSSYGSAKSELTEKVVSATRIAKERAPDIQLDGELQADAALVMSIGKSKAPQSTIAGQANVLVFPDLNSGNIAYKLTQRLARAEAFGLISQGLEKPINDLSRGCSAEDIVGVVAITSVQSQNREE